MKNKNSKPGSSVKTPQPPQVIDPSRKPVEKNDQKKKEIKPSDRKALSPNEEL